MLDPLYTKSDCGLCLVNTKSENYRLILENKHATSAVLYNPINATHQMILPKRHVLNLTDLTGDEAVAIFSIQEQVIDRLLELFPSEEPEKYSPVIAMNKGKAQTQVHLHWQIYVQASHTRHSYREAHNHDQESLLGVVRKGEWVDQITHPQVPRESFLEEIANALKGTGNLQKDRKKVKELTLELFPK